VGSVANSVFTCLCWGTRADRLLENQRLSAAVRTENRAEKCLYFEFATEPAHALLDVCAGAVDYARTALPVSNRHALIDQIARPRALHLVTVEFDTEAEAQAFQPLDWFGLEVTGDPRYTHHSIALKGLDEVPKITLSDAALNSLIDTLEGRFPAQTRMTTNRPKARQVPVAQAKAQTGDQIIKVDLDEIEKAMMREMERALQKGSPE
jgi:CYTH domain-containing protein